MNCMYILKCDWSGGWDVFLRNWIVDAGGVVC